MLFIASCSAPYKGLKEMDPVSSVYRFQPEFNKTLYRCIVDGRFIFKKFHLSGLLFFKELKNGTIRAIFQNEMGIAFFDFEWDNQRNFKVKQIMPQMDKDAVVKTLQKDLEMLLMIGMEKDSEKLMIQDRGKEQLYRLKRVEGYVYYTVNGDSLVKIENANTRNKIVSVNVKGKALLTSMPDTILFDHHKANFTISLTKIERNVNE